MKHPFFLALLACLQLISCGVDHVDKKLSEEVLRHVTPDKKSVALKDITSYSWDSLYILPPYIPDKRLDSQLIKHHKIIKKSGISQLDHFYLLMLFKNGELTAFTYLSRGEIEIPDPIRLNANGKMIPYGHNDSISIEKPVLDPSWKKQIK